MAGGLELDNLQGPFQPKPLHDSMISTYASINYILGHWILAIGCILFPSYQRVILTSSLS